MKISDVKKVVILGTEYTIIFSGDEEEYSFFKDCNGYIDFTTKTIYIRNDWGDSETMDNMQDLINKNVRHEIIHAFLYESGLYCDSKASKSWACNEEMVDWIAIQYPKINKVFYEVGVNE